MSKNIIICCDGTAGKFGENNTNVVALCEMVKVDPSSQLLFYDPGLGTFSLKSSLFKVTKGFYKALGLAFGLGLTKNMLDAYAFLMNHYEEGDKIFLFGFSRGAHTARAVAAMIFNCGLLHKGNENLLPYAAELFKNRFKDEKKHPKRGTRTLKEFKRIFSRSVPIHFVGLWDSVSSVGWIWDPQILPNTFRNRDVLNVRQALAIDERRAFFKQNLWGIDSSVADTQDVKQVWFAGVHGDVGGDPTNPNINLAHIALEWMVIEAQQKGLILDETAVSHILCTPNRPDHRTKIAQSLTAVWQIGEYFPKFVSIRQKDGAYKKRIRFNRGRARFIFDNALVHESALNKKEDAQAAYRPTNWPSSPEIEPWVKWGC